MDAYRRSLDTQNAQTENLSRIVLRAKQALWAARETARLREMDETLKAVEVLIEADLQRGLEELQRQLDAGEIGAVGFGEDQGALRADAEKRVKDLREAFRIASKGEVAERVSLVACGGHVELMLTMMVAGCAGLFDRRHYIRDHA